MGSTAGKGRPAGAALNDLCQATGSEGPTTRRELMRSSHMCGRTLATSLIAFGIGLALAATASADPTDTAEPDPATPGAVGTPPTISTQVASDGSSASASACKLFGTAINYAAINYEDFAYATAGGGNYVNYGDPEVTSSNVAGRT